VDELRQAWEENAAAWVEWARAPGHDSYWRFHRDVFLEMVPAPSGRTLDLGCGEGRLARDLAALGHDMAGIDVSPTMVAAAREAAPEMELHVADAAALPFEDSSFGLVVAFMSLQDIDDLPGAIREAARVLAPGGRFCLAIVHPFSSAGKFTAREPDAPFVVEGSYLDERTTDLAVERDGRAMRFVSRHTPLETYVDQLAAGGLLVERLREPRLPDAAFRDVSGLRWQRMPLFLHLRALKPAV
jgi:SAM-dependent methyltransferase